MVSPPTGLSGRSIGTTTSWPGVSDRPRRDLGDRPAVDGGRVAVEQVALEQLAHHQADAARLEQVRGREPAAGLQVGDDRGPVGDRPERVDVELDPELVGDREEVEDAVRRPARGGDRGDRVLERRPGHEAVGPHVAPDEVHDELAGAAGRRVLRRVLGRDAVQARGGQPEELEDHAHRVGRELAAAGAPARGRRRSRPRRARRGVILPAR